MTLFAQHGWGKSDKIDTGLREGILSGVIMSPKDEMPARLQDYVRKIRADHPNATVMFDPQLYASTIADARLGKLLEYGYFDAPKVYRDFVGAQNIAAIVRGTIDYQAGLEVTRLVSPTVGIESFSDRWRPVAVNLANESISYVAGLADERPLILSILINEAALTSRADVDAFLDSLTDLEWAGFYFVVVRDMDGYRQTFLPEALAGLMYITYVLAEQNDFEVYFGYTDYCSVALHAAGATASACGWTAGLRRFDFGRFEPSSGGRRPRERYSSQPLLNNVYITPELDQIAENDLLDDVLTGTTRDTILDVNVPSSVAWPPDIAALHHWQSVGAAITDVARRQDTVAKLDRLDRVLNRATALYDSITEAEIVLSTESGPTHLEHWKRATEEFRERIGR